MYDSLHWLLAAQTVQFARYQWSRLKTNSTFYFGVSRALLKGASE